MLRGGTKSAFENANYKHNKKAILWKSRPSLLVIYLINYVFVLVLSECGIGVMIMAMDNYGVDVSGQLAA